MKKKVIRINIKDLMSSEEALACYHDTSDREAWISFRDLYPVQRELVWRKAEDFSDLVEYDESFSGVVINRSDEISTVVICTYENNDIFIRKWIGDDFEKDAPTVVKGMMSAAIREERYLNMLCIENISRRGKSFLKMLMS